MIMIMCNMLEDRSIMNMEDTYFFEERHVIVTRVQGLNSKISPVPRRARHGAPRTRPVGRTMESHQVKYLWVTYL